ncbi:MAG: LemA family protein [Planctomycetota bacterium]|nr:LemA family protein [Planctomycetota bacterium]
MLTGAMGRLAVVMEAYPELKANESVANLPEELTSTENKIAFARQAYNDWVTNFNTYRESFPQIVFANWFGHTQRVNTLDFDDQPQIHSAPQAVLV